MKENYETLMSLEKDDSRSSNTKTHDWKLSEKPEREKMLSEREKEETPSCSDWGKKGKNVNKQKHSPEGSAPCEHSTSNIIQMRDQRCLCDVCEIFLSDHFILKSHPRSDNEETPSTCTNYGKNVCQKREPQGQQKTCIKETYSTSSECGKGFSRKKELVQHEIIHKTRVYTSTEYGKSFPNRENITKYQKNNTNERLASYPGCDKSFNQEENLIRNAKFYPGETLVSSTECMKSFSHEDAFIDYNKVQTGRQTY
ncbi:gastrula zinc finger protein XlCGF7.1-like [Microcaecilia unicolor]|uniref:Gastrula zinc finger protein XlCGF7.1-like n=1 Tax=Microcaecilia unicolor TaxID=1415580 RepID=A0A6P7YMJ9_9AMPH|nr:gastrula zinc finger protein XlCGF7.1-like [Microcaecilia unicolor]